MAYLAACDSMYIYPGKIKDEDNAYISRGMKHEIKEAKKLGLQIEYKEWIEDTAITGDGWTSPNWQLPKRKESEEKSIEITIEGKSYPLKWQEKKGNSINISIEGKSHTLKLPKKTDGTKKDSIEFEGNVLRKRVFVCTELRGKALSWDDILEELEKGNVEIPPQSPTEDEKNEMAEKALKIRMRENVRNALWQCHDLAMDDKAFLAPFAPQAFFTYFWDFPIKVKETGGEWCMKKSPEWTTWFDKSLEVLKVCDAVYMYSKDGLPDYGNLSEGMEKVYELAEQLGIEIKYKQQKTMEKDWNIALPDFQLGFA